MDKHNKRNLYPPISQSQCVFILISLHLLIRGTKTHHDVSHVFYSTTHIFYHTMNSQYTCIL